MLWRLEVREFSSELKRGWNENEEICKIRFNMGFELESKSNVSISLYSILEPNIQSQKVL